MKRLRWLVMAGLLGPAAAMAQAQGGPQAGAGNTPGMGMTGLCQCQCPPGGTAPGGTNAPAVMMVPRGLVQGVVANVIPLEGVLVLSTNTGRVVVRATPAQLLGFRRGVAVRLPYE